MPRNEGGAQKVEDPSVKAVPNRLSEPVTTWGEMQRHLAYSMGFILWDHLLQWCFETHDI